MVQESTIKLDVDLNAPAEFQKLIDAMGPGGYFDNVQKRITVQGGAVPIHEPQAVASQQAQIERAAEALTGVGLEMGRIQYHVKEGMLQATQIAQTPQDARQAANLGDIFSKGVSRLVPGGQLANAFKTLGLVGGIATGIVAILGFVKGMFNHSQILSTYGGAFMKIFGHFADLIMIAFLPLLNVVLGWLITKVRPVVQDVSSWISDNPKLATAIATTLGGLLLARTLAPGLIGGALGMGARAAGGSAVGGAVAGFAGRVRNVLSAGGRAVTRLVGPAILAGGGFLARGAGNIIGLGGRVVENMVKPAIRVGGGFLARGAGNAIGTGGRLVANLVRPAITAGGVILGTTVGTSIGTGGRLVANLVRPAITAGGVILGTTVGTSIGTGGRLVANLVRPAITAGGVILGTTVGTALGVMGGVASTLLTTAISGGLTGFIAGVVAPLAAGAGVGFFGGKLIDDIMRGEKFGTDRKQGNFGFRDIWNKIGAFDNPDMPLYIDKNGQPEYDPNRDDFMYDILNPTHKGRIPSPLHPDRSFSSTGTNIQNLNVTINANNIGDVTQAMKDLLQEQDTKSVSYASSISS